MAENIEVDMTLKGNGVTKEMFLDKVDEIAWLAYEDQCTTANPKEPLIEELKQILYMAYDGTGEIN